MDIFTAKEDYRSPFKYLLHYIFAVFLTVILTNCLDIFLQYCFLKHLVNISYEIFNLYFPLIYLIPFTILFSIAFLTPIFRFGAVTTEQKVLSKKEFKECNGRQVCFMEFSDPKHDFIPKLRCFTLKDNEYLVNTIYTVKFNSYTHQIKRISEKSSKENPTSTSLEVLELMFSFIFMIFISVFVIIEDLKTFNGSYLTTMYLTFTLVFFLYIYKEFLDEPEVPYVLNQYKSKLKEFFS